MSLQTTNRQAKKCQMGEGIAGAMDLCVNLPHWKVDDDR